MSRRTWFLLALFAIAAWGLAAVASYQLFVAPANTGFDFYPRGTGPASCSPTATPIRWMSTWTSSREMQTGTTPPDHNFFYPAYITYILLPFWLLPWPAAISLWMGLTLIALLVLPTVTFQTLNWRLPTGRLFIITLVSVFVFRQAMITYVIGQFTAWVLTCLILAWVGIVKQNTSLTVLALVGSTIRPDGVIITALVLLELLTSQRWQLVARWAAVMVGLFALSVLQAGFLDSPLSGSRQHILYLLR